MFNIALPLIIFLFPMAYSPGPGNMFFAAIGARAGTLASLPANIGYHAATWIVTFAIGFGFADLVERFPHAFTVIKYAGSVYVLWLAWKIFRAGSFQGGAQVKSAGFADGALLLILNPKAYMIIALMFTQFLPPDAENFTQLVLVITTIFTLNNVLAFVVWAALGEALSRFFRDERHARVANMIFAMLLVLIAVWMAAT